MRPIGIGSRNYTNPTSTCQLWTLKDASDLPVRRLAECWKPSSPSKATIPDIKEKETDAVFFEGAATNETRRTSVLINDERIGCSSRFHAA